MCAESKANLIDITAWSKTKKAESRPPARPVTESRIRLAKS
jgi:hypothetical protein